MKRDKDRKMIRRLGFLSLFLTFVFIIAVAVGTYLNAGRLDIYLPNDKSPSSFHSENDIIDIRRAADNERHIILTAKEKGHTIVHIEQNGMPTDYDHIRVLPGGIIYDSEKGNFSGYRAVTILAQIYILLISGLFIVSFILRCRSDLFSYTTLFYGGTALFLSSISINMLLRLAWIINNNEQFTMANVYSIIKNSGSVFIKLSLPIIIVFSAALIMSNISLIRHEGKGFVNMLGLILSALLICGYIFAILIENHLLSSAEKQMRIFGTITSAYETAFVYFEAMLMSTVICGFIAALKKPSYDKTHIIIPGCAIASDGTPLPLLKARIDNAIKFAKEQKFNHGKQIKFVPSGGKGSDEIISEAESMTNYLVSHGIKKKLVIPETESTNTQENMRFSLNKIKSECDDPKIIFSTSDYHVLRSGMIAQSEGLDTEGIGCKTVWYFWPNAFVREFVGLLASKWRQHMFWILLLILLFLAVNILIPM